MREVHFKIKAGRCGWVRAMVYLPDGSEERYNYFYNADEAKVWCYAKLAYNYGAALANKELPKRAK